ncbi:MAG: tRNA (N6-threonylcarbamoyladenosine(37)-N6)-methyltransferase TrmO [Bacteroidales bacterium]|nr:tRNA (N6-threonylcarbamoyladenosine(37)-N6)-methyltransferase TrmO [Bacteroidales bacterium]
MKNIIKPIGIIYSQNKTPKGTPIQSSSAKNISGVVEVYPEFVDGLKDLDGFSHIILLYYFHLSKEAKLISKPFMDDVPHGVFATRAPSRPNPIGISYAKIEKIEGNKIFVTGLDVLNETPLIDIKPYIPEFDHNEVEKIGWVNKNINKLPETKDDGRFAK